MPYHTDASAPPSDPFNPAATQLLDDTQWQLAHWQQANGQVIDVPPGAPVTLELSTESGQRRASGTAGCNHYTGQYVLKNGLLSFNQLATTQMACIGAVSQIESTYLGALAHIARTGVQIPASGQPQQLLLQLDNGDQLTFVQRSAPDRSSH